MIRTLIVEDVPLVRQGIRLFLKSEPDVEIVGEACDGPDAVAHIEALRPDLVFMDIQMPGFDGFEVLDRCKESAPRAVIFITAHANYAMRAFDTDAVSYLLKPVDPKRFAEVMDRARLMLRCAPGRPIVSVQAEAPLTAEHMVVAQNAKEQYLTRLLVKQGDRFLLIRTEEINWISAYGEYAILHTARGSPLLRMSLSELADRLDRSQFTRIHRATIVKLDRIQEIQPRSHGDCDILLDDGNTLRMSRNYRDALFR